MATRRLRIVVVTLLALGMTAPLQAATNLMPEAAAYRAPEVRDVALQESGMLVGQLVDGQGTALADANVIVGKAGKGVAQVVTDSEGRFQVTGLKGGVHQILAAGQLGSYRLWAPRTAPPAATAGVMLVSSTDTVRGQGVGCGTRVCDAPTCGSGCAGCSQCDVYGRRSPVDGIRKWMCCHPYLTGGAIASAIIIPFIDDCDCPPAS
ncbi:MAG: carboxypeptidase-like regulatory domain-containing protein [Planctomycetota bacterium]